MRGRSGFYTYFMVGILQSLLIEQGHPESESCCVEMRPWTGHLTPTLDTVPPHGPKQDRLFLENLHTVCVLFAVEILRRQKPGVIFLQVCLKNKLMLNIL